MKKIIKFDLDFVLQNFGWREITLIILLILILSLLVIGFICDFDISFFGLIMLSLVFLITVMSADITYHNINWDLKTCDEYIAEGRFEEAENICFSILKEYPDLPRVVEKYEMIKEIIKMEENNNDNRTENN